MRRTLLPLIVWFLSSLVAAGALSQVQYTVTDLGDLPNGYSPQPTAINNNGQVAGDFWLPPVNQYDSYHQHAFLYSGGAMQDLGTLGGSDSVAEGINNNGEVVGWSYAAIAGQSAFIYSGGTMQSVNGLNTTPGWSLYLATAITDNGEVVGSGYNPSGRPSAFLYSGGTVQDLGTLGGSSSALGMNSTGMAVGWSATGAYTGSLQLNGRHAVVYSGGSVHDLGSLLTHDQNWGGDETFGTAINDSGQVVGYADARAPEAFLYSSGTMQDLGTLGGATSQADGINNLDQVVGSAYNSVGVSDAFLWEPGSGMVDLNSLIPQPSEWTLTTATAINDNGLIVGTGLGPSGVGAALLLTPISSPEPSTFALLGVGGIALIAYAWRRKRRAAKLRCRLVA
ncbi:MAG: DUF3466 family protein [Thermoguttaceae bacterium]|jgi:probable HAF family extracellular repeat protein